MLDMLAASPEGVLEPVLRAHRFNPKLILATIRAGLATGKLESAIVGNREAFVMRVKITGSGLLARQPTMKRKPA